MAANMLGIKFVTSYLLVLVVFLLLGEQSFAQAPAPDRFRRRIYPGLLTAENFTTASMFVGVGSSGVHDLYTEHRKIIRNTYQHFVKDVNMEFKFFISTRVPPARLEALRKENETEKDLILLDTVDHPNWARKTFDFFQWAAVNRPNVDFVMKTDDDSWLHVYHLQRLIDTMPKRRAYWGHLLYCRAYGPNCTYMAGAGYIISQDMVQWIHTNANVIANDTLGLGLNNMEMEFEDIMMGKWLAAAGLQRDAYFSGAATWFEFYDWGPDERWFEWNNEAKDGLPPVETILVHRLKRSDVYVKLHEYFLSSFRRWEACVEKKFAQPQCLAALNFNRWFRHRHQHRHRQLS